MAGPNGSGKSTLINRIKNNFFCGPFVNADLIERSFSEKGLLNLADFNLNLTKKSFDYFIKKEGTSWMQKADDAHTTVSITFSNNNLVVVDKPNAYVNTRATMLHRGTNTHNFALPGVVL
jgi:predicted kinase